MMQHSQSSASPRGAIEVEAELGAPGAHAQLVRYHFSVPPNSVLRVEDKFRVELCLTSRHRNSQACFRDQWRSNRFERIGSLFLVPPGFDLLVRSDEINSLTAIVFEFDADYVYELFDQPPDLTDQHLLSSLDIRVPKLRSVLVRAAEEAKQPGFASTLLTELLARQAAIELVRHGNTLKQGQTRGGLASWQLRLIDERLEEAGEAPTLSELAELCRLSIRHLARGFRVSKGRSIGAYVAHCQMEHAKRLLTKDQSMGLIAATLGFSSASNFCFAFRRATGLTPGQFRAMLLRH